MPCMLEIIRMSCLLPSRHAHVLTQCFSKFCKASCSVRGWHEWNFPTFRLRTFRLKIMGCLVVGGILHTLWAFALHIKNWCGSLSAHFLLETLPSCNGSAEWPSLIVGTSAETDASIAFFRVCMCLYWVPYLPSQGWVGMAECSVWPWGGGKSGSGGRLQRSLALLRAPDGH